MVDMALSFQESDGCGTIWYVENSCGDQIGTMLIHRAQEIRQ